MKLIVHNDDFGLNFGFSEAIIDCHKNGITTSTSVRVNGTAYKQTLKGLKKNSGLDIGLHLNLTDGFEFRKNFLSYLLPIERERAKKALENQFIQAIKKDNLKIDHVNSHDHIHMIPWIFEITASLCKKYKIKYLRLVDENYYLTGNIFTDIKPFVNTNIFKLTLLRIFAKININTLKKYKLKTVHFYGILHTDNMNVHTFTGALEDAKKRKYNTVEILSHPVYQSKKDKVFTSQFIKEYSKRKTRLVEAKTLKSRKLKEYLKRNKIGLINFGKI